MRGRGVVVGALAYLSYVGGVVLATWPLARAPATTWPRHHDPALFTWVMASMARWLVHGPLELFDGNAFYPYGESLAYSEPLLVPAALGLPGFVWGNPILTYNLLVLLLWPLNGLAMAWAAHQLTGSRRAAWLAGAVFCLTPYFTEYHLEFNMLPAAPIPMALVAWVRWLETQRSRWLVLALFAFALQGLTTWYYAIILALGLATVTVGFVALRWDGWRWRADLPWLAGGVAGLSVVLLPVAVPYLLVRRQLGFERSLGETALHFADVLSFVLPGARSRYFPVEWMRKIQETEPFVGYGVLALALVACGWLGHDRSGGSGATRLRRGLLAALGACGLLFVLAAALNRPRLRLGALALRLRPGTFLTVMLLLGLALLVLRGWRRQRLGASRALDRGDWVCLLALLTAFSAGLALGPVIHVGGRDMGHGPYTELYWVIWPLHAIRNTTRIAVLTVAGLALLAALGWARIEAGLTPRRVRAGLWMLVLAVLAFECAVRAPDYRQILAPRPVDTLMRADPEDVAVLEWPTFDAFPDTDAMFRSLYHGKRVVNGHSGFSPPWLRELSEHLSDLASPDGLSASATIDLRRVYPLRYLVVRGDDLSVEDWRRWQTLRQAPPPLLRLRGGFDAERLDLYEVIPLPERGRHLERWMSAAFVRAHPVLDATAAPAEIAAGRIERLEIRQDGHLLQRRLLDGPVHVHLDLEAPASRAAPVRIALDLTYAPRPEARGDVYRIGATGVISPADIEIRSTGTPHGEDDSWIRVNGRERPRGYGYHLLAVGAEDQVDPAPSTDDAAALTAWIAALPAGTVVAGAARGTVGGWLTSGFVAALRTLGVRGDLRGTQRVAHAFIGVKGAPPGSVPERIGPEPVLVSVGRPAPPGMELQAFHLAGAGR